MGASLRKPKPSQEITATDSDKGLGCLSALSTTTPSDKDAITQRNKEESPLLRLPAEVRNLIYEYALGGNQIWIHLPDDTAAPPTIRGGPEGPSLIKTDDDSPDTIKTLPHLLALTEVCRQIHCETLNLAFKVNSFGEWGEPQGAPLPFQAWYNRLNNVQYNAIKNMRVPCMDLVSISSRWLIEIPPPENVQRVISNYSLTKTGTRMFLWMLVLRGVDRWSRREDVEVIYEERGEEKAWKSKNGECEMITEEGED